MSNKNQQSNRRERSPRPREPQEYEQKVLDIARVARVVAGGRRFSFRAVVVIGNRKGKVGLGVGKGRDVSIAINKATRKAKKEIFKVPMTKDGTLPHEITGKQSGSVVLLMPGISGRGIVAGGAVRAVCDLAGYKDITTKILSRSTNKLNVALATMKALKKVRHELERPINATGKKEKVNQKKANKSKVKK